MSLEAFDPWKVKYYLNTDITRYISIILRVLEKQLSNKESHWLSVLRRAADAGKRAILSNYDYSERRTVIGRGAGGDLTLKIDKISETAIHRSLIKDLKGESFVFVSEELGEKELPEEGERPVVVCDPLDGSHNAQVGIPFFAISLSVLGLRRKLPQNEKRYFRDVDIGVIQSVPTSDEFTAIKGKGAVHNGNSISNEFEKFQDGKKIETLEIECGDVNYLKKLIMHLTAQEIYKIRTLGSAALGFSLLANGTIRGFIFAQPSGARTIDSPAGYLIAKESGRIVTDLSGKLNDLDSVEIGFHSRMSILGAANKIVHKQLSRILNDS